MRGEYVETLETIDLEEARQIARGRMVYQGCQILMERSGRLGLATPAFEGLAKSMGGWRRLEVVKGA